MSTICRAIEELVKKGKKERVAVSSVMTKLRPAFRDIVHRFGGISAFVRIASAQTTLRVRTGKLGGAAYFDRADLSNGVNA